VELISEERRKEEEEQQKEKLLGFTLIFEEIWNSNKTIIGHNCLYDLLFVYSAFIDELPKDYQNFKKLLYHKR
jgi:poly(A)-specific ribonuclease